MVLDLYSLCVSGLDGSLETPFNYAYREKRNAARIIQRFLKKYYYRKIRTGLKLADEAFHKKHRIRHKRGRSAMHGFWITAFSHATTIELTWYCMLTHELRPFRLSEWVEYDDPNDYRRIVRRHCS